MVNTSLSNVSVPGLFRCVDVLCEGDCAVQLKRLGICEGRDLEVIQCGDPMVVRIVGAEIGVSRSLAASVLVSAEKAAEVLSYV